MQKHVHVFWITVAMLMLAVGWGVGFYQGRQRANLRAFYQGLEAGQAMGVSDAAAAYESGGMDAVIRLEKDLEK